MPRKTKVYHFDGHLYAAYSLSGAKKMAREDFCTAAGMKPVTGSVEYCDEEGRVIGAVDAEDCSAVWPKPERLPEL
jgi:hypothetical protein